MILTYHIQAGRRYPQQSYSKIVNYGRTESNVGSNDTPPVTTGDLFWNRHRPGPVAR